METSNEGQRSKTPEKDFSALKKQLFVVGSCIFGVSLIGQIVGLALEKKWPSPWRIGELLLVLFCIASTLLGMKLLGTVEYVQIYSPDFEQRIRARYQTECDQLRNLGFDQIFFFGESFPLIRLLLVFPVLLVLMMWSKKEVMTIHDGTKFLAGYPIFSSRDKTTFGHPSGLGIKFHTAFQDGTILVTKNYGGISDYGSTVVAQCMKEASISELWTAHQRRAQELEAVGKRSDRQISFEAYSKISRIC